MNAPVKAEHAVATRDTRSLEHDVVARFTIVIGIVTLSIQYVMANNRAVKEQL